MPPIDWSTVTPEMIQQLVGQGAALPTYSASKKAYLPWDSGDQKAALSLANGLQDWMFDPRNAQLAGEGAYNSNAMQLAMQQYAPAVTAGQDYLNNIMSKSQGSPQAVVAELLLQGLSPQEALIEGRRQIESGGGKWPSDPMDAGVDDKRIVDFANSAWEKYMADSPQQGTNDPYARAAFSDPSMRFTPMMMDKSLGGKLDRADASKAAMEKAQAAWAGQRNRDDTYAANLRTVEEHAPTDPRANPFEALAPGSGTITVPGMGTIDVIPAAREDFLTRWKHDHQAQAPVSQPFNPLAQNATHATLNWAKDANAAAMAAGHATVKANETAAQYGSPFMMEYAQRMALARQLGIAQ